MTQKQRVDQQPGFVLHTYPWRETSLIVEVFSRDHGRVAMVAKGARRPMSALRGVLMAFQPLQLSWSGGGEVKTLVRAEWQGGQPLLTGRALLCGYYLNELLVKLSAREDPHPALFDAYAQCLRELAADQGVTPILRRFELSLLSELGYAVLLEQDARSGAAVVESGNYLYIIEHGPVALMQGDEPGNADGMILSGRTLLNMAAGDFTSPETLVQSKGLLRLLINHYLGGQILQSRRVFTELQLL